MSIANVSRIGLVTLATGLTALLLGAVPSATAGEPWLWQVEWIPSAKVSLALRLDALSLVFALLVTGIGAVVAGYAASYQRERTGRFYAYLTLFMVAMLGVVLADDLVLLYVFWELTSVASFFLIGFDHDEAEARDAARHALLVTVLGGLCLFAGVVLPGRGVMPLLLALLVGALFAAGVYLILRRSTVKILIGLSLLGHAANLFVFSAAGPEHREPPVIPEGRESLLHAVADPLPQALILTAIVITFAVVAFAVVLVHRTHESSGVRDVDSLADSER